MFQNSLRIVDECGLTFLHVFPFSPRPGTPAARMPQLDRLVIKERAALLREQGRGTAGRFPHHAGGQHTGRAGGDTAHGRTPHFALARFSQQMTPGAIVRTRVTAASGDGLNVVPGPAAVAGVAA